MNICNFMSNFREYLNNVLWFLTHNCSICSKLGNKVNAQKDARDSKFSCYVQKVAKQLKVSAFSRSEILRFIGLGTLVWKLGILENFCLFQKWIEFVRMCFFYCNVLYLVCMDSSLMIGCTYRTPANKGRGFYSKSIIRTNTLWCVSPQIVLSCKRQIYFRKNIFVNFFQF